MLGRSYLLLQWVRLKLMRLISNSQLHYLDIEAFWHQQQFRTKFQKIFKVRNQGKSKFCIAQLIVSSLKYKHCDRPYFHFRSQEDMKMLFVNKKGSVFAEKYFLFPQNLLTKWVFFNYPMSFWFTQVQDEIQEFDYRGNKKPDFFVEAHFDYCLLYCSAR